VIGGYVRLKKRGKNFIGLCPFHTEKTPSFTVSPDKQIYHCFGCGAGGNVFTFLMEHEKMSFVEAARFLAQRAGIIIRETGTDARRDDIERLNYAHEIALDYFRRLLRSPKYKVVLDQYLKGRRNIAEESIEQFRLGLAGESWDGLLAHAAKKDMQPEELVKAGLAVKSETKGTYFDRFRQRLMIPIFNLSQKPIAFGGRTLKKGEPAKYVNSPETPLYSKSNVLYALNFARDHVRDANAAYVVEGYFDVISLWQAGVKNVVASSGTAFTLQQARLIARFAEQVYLFFDADSAGQKAALRSVDSLYNAGLEVSIIVPPGDEDPDSIARKFGRDRIEELRTEAVGYIPFRVKNTELESAGIIAKEKLIKEMKGVGDNISDPTRRSLFFVEAADVLGIDVHILQTAKAAAPSATKDATRPQRKYRPEEFEFLSLLLNNPGSIDNAFEMIAPDDFDSKALARLYAAMISHYRKKGSLDPKTLVETVADREAASLLTEIATVEWEPDRIEPETRIRTRLMGERKRRRIREKLKLELAEAEANGDQTRAEQIIEEMKQHGVYGS
jgi:DNA primase